MLQLQLSLPGELTPGPVLQFFLVFLENGILLAGRHDSPRVQFEKSGVLCTYVAILETVATSRDLVGQDRTGQDRMGLGAGLGLDNFLRV